MLALVASSMGCPVAAPVAGDWGWVECDSVDPYADADGDGYELADGDCDDADPSINPGADEPCDGPDNNCDAWVDEVLACGE